MIRDRLFIYGIEVDLLPDTVIALTYQVNDLAELKDRQANYTNRFKLPKTHKNLSVIENADLVQSPTKLPYRKIPVKVIKDGVEVIPSGFGIIDTVDEFIYISCYSGNADFFFLLEGLNLNDLDLSAYDHSFDINHAMTTWTNTQGYKYSLINHGDIKGTDDEIDFTNQRATFFVHTLMKEIITQQGFNYAGKLFSDEKLLKLLITTANGNEKNIYYDHTGGDVLLQDTVPNGAMTEPYISVEADGLMEITINLKYRVSGWINSTSNLMFRFQLNTGAGVQYEHIHTDLQGDGDFDVTITFTVNNLTYSGGIFQCRFFGNNVDAYFTGGELSGAVFGGSTGLTDPPSEPDFNLLLNPYPDPLTLITDPDLWIGWFYEEDIFPIPSVSTIFMAKYMPDISQRDFLKAIAQVFAGIFVVDSETKTVTIVRFEEVIENIPLSRDWSDKLHWERHNHSTDFRFGSYARSNQLLYTEDANDLIIARNLSNGTLDIDDETLNSEKELFKLPFAHSRMLSVLGGSGAIPQVIQIEDGDWGIEVVPRLLIDNTQDIDVGDAFNYTDGVINNPGTYQNIPFCYFRLAGKDFNLSFANSLKADNYTSLEKMLNKSRMLTVQMKLTPEDVVNFDHTIPIFLSQFAAYFYVNKIVNFTGRGLTKVEVIRLETDNELYNDYPLIPPYTQLENYELQEDFGLSMQEDGTTISGREAGN